MADPAAAPSLDRSTAAFARALRAAMDHAPAGPGSVRDRALYVRPVERVLAMLPEASAEALPPIARSHSLGLRMVLEEAVDRYGLEVVAEAVARLEVRGDLSVLPLPAVAPPPRSKAPPGPARTEGQ
jgi:hypothetical protein